MPGSCAGVNKGAIRIRDLRHPLARCRKIGRLADRWVEAVSENGTNRRRFDVNLEVDPRIFDLQLSIYVFMLSRISMRPTDARINRRCIFGLAQHQRHGLPDIRTPPRISF